VTEASSAFSPRLSRTAVEVVTIGDELLLGFTIDTKRRGWPDPSRRSACTSFRRGTSGDDPDQIAAVVGEALARNRRGDYHRWTRPNVRRSNERIHRHIVRPWHASGRSAPGMDG